MKSLHINKGKIFRPIDQVNLYWKEITKNKKAMTVELSAECYNLEQNITANPETKKTCLCFAQVIFSHVFFIFRSS